MKWKKLTNKEIVKEWNFKEMIKSQGEVGNFEVVENFKIIKGELYQRKK